MAVAAVRSPSLRYIALAAGVVLLLALAWVWRYGAERRAIRSLDGQARHALYERTLQTLRDPCASSARPHALDDFCAGQAEFILEFPECDKACQALAAESRPHASR